MLRVNTIISFRVIDSIHRLSSYRVRVRVRAEVRLELELKSVN